MFNKKGIVILMTAVMLFSGLFALIPASATPNQGTSNQLTSIGTVTLNPPSGAFPGQLVTYTWSGVPTDLVPPVYVTVYLNGVPYSTQVSTYNNGVLTGSFVMPNDQPGTTFMVSLSYKDSAMNYGVSASGSGSSAVTTYVSPVNVFNTTVTATSGTPYTIKGIVNYSAVQPTTTKFNGGSNELSGYTNTTFSASPSSVTILTTKDLTTSNLDIMTNFDNVSIFKSVQNAENVTLNTTVSNSGPAQLSLPAQADFNSTFKYSGTTINKIYLAANISQIINGQRVTLLLNGSYQSAISSIGNYTLLGSVYASSPSSLANVFSGQFSASYDIKSIELSKTHKYINYTLSVNINAQTKDNVVSLSAQYLNATTQVGNVSKNDYNVSVLTVQSGYSFKSIYLSLSNPGIAAIGNNFTNNYTLQFGRSSLYTKNLTITFSNFTTAPIPTLLWYDNMTRISLQVGNTTLSGYINFTVSTSSYSPGVDYISPAVWTFTYNLQLNLADKLGQKINGTASGSNTYSTTVLSSGVTQNVLVYSEIKPFKPEFTEILGLPTLKSFEIPYTTYTLSYLGGMETVNLEQNFSWAGSFNLNISNTQYSHFSAYVNSTVLGFNFTNINSNYNKHIKLYINATWITPVMYGFSKNGNLTITELLKGYLNFNSNKYVNESFIGNFTPITATTPFTLVNEYGYSSTYTVQNNTYANYSISNILGTINYAGVTGGYVIYTSPFFLGQLEFNGKGYSDAHTINLGTTGSSATAPGNITSISGLKNSTILGWYNTTFKVIQFAPALYGLSGMNGFAKISVMVRITNVSHSLNYDPMFYGQQNDTLNVSILSSLPKYNNATFTLINDSQNLTLKGNGYSGYIEDATLTGSFSLTNTLYNLTDSYNYEYTLGKLSFFNSGSATYPKGNFTPVSYDVLTPINSTKLTLNALIASPIENLTLIPLANISFKAEFTLLNRTTYYNISGQFIGSTVSDFSYANLSTFMVSGEGSVNAKINTNVQESTFTLQGTQSGIIYTSNTVYVSNSGTVPLTGISESEFGSGTLAGTLKVTKIYPLNKSTESSAFILTGSFGVQGFFGNGTQYYLSVDLSNAELPQYVDIATTMPVTTTINYNIFSEMPNTGTSLSYSYSLLNGSGAMIMSISQSQIVEIATLSGQYVNMTLSQLNVKLSSVWSTENNTYVTMSTDFGTMTAQLTAINATIMSVSSGVANLQTALGNVQVSLSELNAKLIAVNGTVATIQTDVGTIQTSLNNINATVTSMNGNVATVSTDVGALSGTVTAINGTVATINTKLGTLQTSVSGITSSVGTAKSGVSSTLTFEVIVLVLVLITLVIALVSMLNVNRAIKKIDEMKKQ